LSVNSGLPTSNDRFTYPYVRSLVFNHSNVAFAGTYGRGVYVSTNNGANWTPFSIGLQNHYILSLAVTAEGDLYAGTEFGVYRSLDSSNNWTAIHTGLRNAFARAVLLARNGFLLAGTSGSGIFKTTAAVASPELSPEDIPSVFLLHQNYPNPFNATTTIQFLLPEPERVTIKVFDLLGRELATLVSAAFPVGTHQVPWDASSLPSGVYVYHMEAGTFKASKRAVVLR
jgi:hypothetical protein